MPSFSACAMPHMAPVRKSSSRPRPRARPCPINNVTTIHGKLDTRGNLILLSASSTYFPTEIHVLIELYQISASGSTRRLRDGGIVFRGHQRVGPRSLGG